MQSNGTPMPAAAPGTAIVASSGTLGPAAAAPAADSSAAVAYGASSFHVDMAASPGVATNASGLVMFFLNPMESRWLSGMLPCAHGVVGMLPCCRRMLFSFSRVEAKSALSESIWMWFT